MGTLTDATAGVSKAVIELTLEKLNEFVARIKNRDLAFIEDESTITRVNLINNSGELEYYKDFVKDKDQLRLVKMGLTLRKLEEDGDHKRLQSLSGKIRKKYEVEGLHAAQFVQNDILSKYIGNYIKTANSKDDIRKGIAKILGNIEQYALFVKEDYNSNSDIIIPSVQIANVHKPSIFIICGMGPAGDLIIDCEAELVSSLRNYALEKNIRKEKVIFFFERIEN